MICCRFVRNQVESAKPAEGISVGLLAALRAVDQLNLVSSRLAPIDKLVTTQADNEKSPDCNKKVPQDMDEVAIGIGEMMPIGNKHIIPKVVPLILKLAER